jgi:hypothetical protein
MGSVRRSRFKESLFLEAARVGRLTVDRDGFAVLDGRPISQHGNGRGYRLSRMAHEGKRYSIMHHCLVWAYFNGPIPDGREINHINGNKLDNSLANLELTTRSGNLLHACRNGLRDQAAINELSWSKRRHLRLFTPEQVREMRARYAAGETQRSIADSHNARQPDVQKIVARTTYKDVF